MLITRNRPNGEEVTMDIPVSQAQLDAYDNGTPGWVAFNSLNYPQVQFVMFGYTIDDLMEVERAQRTPEPPPAPSPEPLPIVATPTPTPVAKPRAQRFYAPIEGYRLVHSPTGGMVRIPALLTDSEARKWQLIGVETPSPQCPEGKLILRPFSTHENRSGVVVRFAHMFRLRFEKLGDVPN